jgi:hypothetical protein
MVTGLARGTGLDKPPAFSGGIPLHGRDEQATAQALAPGAIH